MRQIGRRHGTAFALAFITLLLAACGASDESSDRITLYSGRGETLIGPLIAQFEADTGIDVRVRYGDSASLAAQILEEGERTPADVFLAQDAGALGAVEDAGLLQTLPDDILNRVDPSFRSGAGAWVGVSGRARVLVYSTDHLSDDDLPSSIFDLVQPQWRGRVGWAPTNGSFQAFVTALRETIGDDRTADWLHAMLDNDVQEYSGNTPIVQAVGDGDIDIGLANHYYVWRFIAENADFPAANLYTDPGQAGALINVAGAALLNAAGDGPAALRFIDYLLKPRAQRYFGSETNEYPLIDGVDPSPGIPTLASLSPPPLSLTTLTDLQGTLDLLRDVGALP